MIQTRLRAYEYESQDIHISKTIIPMLAGTKEIPPKSPRYEYAKALIDLGNAIRKETKNNAVLAIAAAAEISRRRPDPQGQVQKRAYIISSLKNPQEVEELRKIYGGGFYLFAVHADRERRAKQLSTEGEGMSLDLAWKLLLRDEDEDYEYGQHTRDTFHLADFFVADENNDDKLRYSITRCLDLVFANPNITPTFNEFAMFMAFAASLRSADLSRQVGAVVTRRSEILSTGANDCPRAGGGLYWPIFIGDRVDDEPRGRDYKRGFDSNAEERAKLIQRIVGRFPERYSQK
jgi:deoxycytidylate deaminase